MKYGFIGCGNMGGAIASALSHSTRDMILSDRSGKVAALAEKLGCHSASVKHAATESDRLFLAVKPQVISSVIEELAPILRENKPLIITMAAGIEIKRIEQLIGLKLPVIRIMPNTPVMVGCGTILYCYNDAVTEDLLEDFIMDMAPCGLLDYTPEHLIDAASAVSGCGPAYAYMFIEALSDAAVACGIPRSKAINYAANMLSGAAQMVLQTGVHPGALKDAVCSPGGSTIEGVKVLEEEGLRGAVIDCIIAAYHRTVELGK